MEKKSTIACVLAFIIISCSMPVRASFSDNVDDLLCKVAELDIRDSINVYFHGRRAYYKKPIGGYYECRQKGIDTVWVIYVESATNKGNNTFQIDSICTWSGEKSILLASSDWPHEHVETFSKRSSFLEIIGLMELFGLSSFEMVDGHTIMNKVFNNGDYRIIEK